MTTRYGMVARKAKEQRKQLRQMHKALASSRLALDNMVRRYREELQREREATKEACRTRDAACRIPRMAFVAVVIFALVGWWL